MLGQEWMMKPCGLVLPLRSTSTSSMQTQMSMRASSTFVSFQRWSINPTRCDQQRHQRSLDTTDQMSRRPSSTFVSFQRWSITPARCDQQRHQEITRHHRPNVETAFIYFRVVSALVDYPYTLRSTTSSRDH